MYNLSEAAPSDIEEILEKSFVSFGAQQTEGYYIGLKECLEHLGRNPEMDTVVEDLRPGYRRFPHESHVIFYTVHAEDVFIVRILHKHMDAVRKLHE